MKKISASFMIVVLLISQWGYAAAITSTTPAGYEYSVNAGGTTITITSYTGSSEDVIIPEMIDGKTVTGIGANAFRAKQLTSVTIPDVVTTIGDSAFQYNQLTNVTIGKGVTTIGNAAFQHNQLTNVTIGKGVTTIGNVAFESNQLTSVEIPDEVTTIGERAFESNQLTNVTIGKGVTMIGASAFASNQLTSVEIPDEVTTIEKRAFASNQLTNVTIGKGVTTIGDAAFASNQLTNVTIGKGVTSIGASAFYDNQLTSVKIPDKVTTIGNAAFSHNQLTSVKIPDKVTTIGNAAFASNQLTTVVFQDTPTLGNGVFSNQTRTYYTFYSWYKDEALTEGWTDNLIPEPMTLYAKWKAHYLIEPIDNQTLTPLTEGYASGNQPEKAITITNAGTQELTNLSVALSGTDKDSFTVTQQPLASLGAGSPTTFKVKAKDGLATGTYTATVTIEADNMTAQTFTVTQIVNAASTYLIEQMSDQTFSELTAGYLSGSQQTKSLAVKNVGTGELQNVKVTVTGTNASDFTVTEPSAQSLLTGESTPFTIQAKDGLAAGTYTATVTIEADNMTAQTFMVTQVVNPASVPSVPTYLIEPISDQTLPVLTEGYASGSAQSITITNVGTGELNELEVALVGTNASDFIVTQPSETSVTSGDSATFTIRANNGLATGTYTATVTIKADGMIEQTFMVMQVVTPAPTYLIGKISDQTLPELTEGYLSGSQQVQPITITNIGTGELTELEVALVGTNASDFTITKPSKTSVTSGDSAPFTIRAKDGLAAGTYTATVTIEADNMTAQTFTVTQIIRAAYIPTPPLSPPTNVWAMEGDGQATVSFYPPTDNGGGAITMYVVKVYEKGVENPALAKSGIGSPITVTGLTNGTAYTFTVVAKNAVGDSAESDSSNGVIPQATRTPEPEPVNPKPGSSSGGSKSSRDDSTSAPAPVNPTPDPVIEPMILAPYIYGYPDGTFKPNAYVTRAQMATMLARFLTNGDIPKASATFNDTVNSTSRDAIEYVKRIGLFKGETETIFNPNGTITRAQMAEVAARWIDAMCAQDDAKAYCKPVGEGKVFTDVNPNHWAASAIEKVSALGIMTGNSTTTFDPNGSLTRAQAVKVLNQLFERKAMTGIVKSKFSDVPRTHWAIGEIEAAATEVFVEK